MFIRHTHHLVLATYSFFMPWGLKRYYGTGSLHFIPWSCYRRKPLLGQPSALRPATYCPRTDAHSLPFCRDWIRGHAGTRASADFRTFNWRSLEDNSGIRRSGIGSDQRLDLVGGENSTERWLSVGRVSAKIPTSRKEREKWGTRRFRFISHSAATLLASLLNSFARGECFAQRRLP